MTVLAHMALATATRSSDGKASEVALGPLRATPALAPLDYFLRVCGAPPPKSLVELASSGSVWYYHFIRAINRNRIGPTEPKSILVENQSEMQIGRICARVATAIERAQRPRELESQFNTIHSTV